MMQVSHARLAPASWLRLPRRTARLRLTALYGGLFLLFGVALLASTYVLFERATAYRPPHLPAVPHTPSIQPLQQRSLFPPPGVAGKGKPFVVRHGLSNLAVAQHQLAYDRHLLSLLPAAAYGPGKPQNPLLGSSPQLARDQQQLTDDQHQLAQAVRRLAQAVHQLAQAGPVQAAQRASDSHQLLVNSGIALAVVGVLAILAGWLVSGRVLRPIRTITRKARRISSTSLHERLALDGPEDELKELGDTLDELFARLEAAFETQRRFVANASHELRTPLTRERTLVQVALGDPTTPEAWRSTGQELLASNRQQEALIDALLTLASSEGGLDQREPTDLADICRAVLSRPGLDPERLGLRLETSIRPAPLDGDPRLIERLVANLVDNSIGHNVAGGRVHVSTAAVDEGAVLSVSNSGPPVPPAEVDRLFQPFQRLDPRRTHHANGHGLGLSIVRAIAAAHHATITTHPLPEGGLSLTVTFPPSTSPSPSAGRAPRTQRFAAGPVPAPPAAAHGCAAVAASKAPSVWRTDTLARRQDR